GQCPERVTAGETVGWVERSETHRCWALMVGYAALTHPTGSEKLMADMDHDGPGLFEIIHSTRSMRRLKPDPVPEALIRRILEAGTAAPSGGNMQRWRFLVVTDPAVKQQAAVYYKRAWDEQAAPRYRAGAPAPGTSA